jgi:hypothetical protein
MLILGRLNADSVLRGSYGACLDLWSCKTDLEFVTHYAHLQLRRDCNYTILSVIHWSFMYPWNLFWRYAVMDIGNGFCDVSSAVWFHKSLSLASVFSEKHLSPVWHTVLQMFQLISSWFLFDVLCAVHVQFWFSPCMIRTPLISCRTWSPAASCFLFPNILSTRFRNQVGR